MSEKLSAFIPEIQPKMQIVHERKRQFEDAGIALDSIIEGDCIDILKSFPAKSIDLIVTDPPYFLPANSYVGVRGEGYKKRTLADTTIIKTWFERVMAELERVSKDTGSYYVFCDAQSYPIFYQVMFPYCNYVRLLIWDKIVSYNGYTWRHQHELIAWGEKDDSPRIPTGDGDVLRCRGVLQEDRNHPAEKPVELIEKLLLKHKEQNPIVLDPFAGSGSVCIAAKRLGLNFVGIEYEKDHIATAQRRLAEALQQTQI